MGHAGSRHKPEVRVLLLGLDSAGKSTILYKLKNDASVNTVPTIGFNVEMIEAKKKRGKVDLTVWDVGGQKSMRQYWKNFYQDSVGLVYVVDSADTRRLDESRWELEHALKSEFLQDLPVVILANKQDLVESVSVTEITERFNLRKLCAGRDWFIQPCSALSGAGITEGFQRVACLLKPPSEHFHDNIKDTMLYLRSKSSP